MRNASLVCAAAVVVLANALALLHVARNRAGSPNSEVTLTNRELSYFAHPASDDDSGVELNLRWTDLSFLPSPAQAGESPIWLNQSKLRALGFDCSVQPENSEAAWFYRRQRERRAFVALEYDGPAWRAWLQAYEANVAQERARTQQATIAAQQVVVANDPSTSQSRLVPIDADLDPSRLRARHPDRHTVIVLPALISIRLDPFQFPARKRSKGERVRILGSIRQLPTSLHLPLPYSDEFRRRVPAKDALTANLPYRVRLRYGSEHEPWVTALEFDNAP